MLKRKGKKNPNEKRKIDILAEEKFDGDVLKALQYHFDNNMSIEQYIEELDKEESLFVLNWSREVVYESAGGKEKFFELAYYDLKVQPCLDAMKMSEEQLRDTQKNPFISKSLKNLTIMLVGTVLLTVVAVLLIDNVIGKTLSCVIPVFTGWFSLMIAGDIMNIFKFKKAKKFIAEMDEKEKTKEVNNADE